MNLLDLIHQKLELFRLEQRYTRRRNRRSTFVSEAQYVDGEYIYAQNTSYSAKCSSGSDSEDVNTYDNGNGARGYGAGAAEREGKSNGGKGSRRLSRMASGWGNGSMNANKRQSRVNVREVRWEDNTGRS